GGADCPLSRPGMPTGLPANSRVAEQTRPQPRFVPGMIRLKPMRRLLALAALAMLAACGPPLTWTKPNVTEAEARLDYDECTGLARDQAFRESFFGYGYYGYGRFGPGYPWSPYGRAYSPF